MTQKWVKIIFEMMKKLIHFIFKKEHEKAVLILLPLLSIIIASLVLVPQVFAIIDYKNTNKQQPVEITEINETEVTEFPSVQAIETTAPTSEIKVLVGEEDLKVHLTAQSIEKDLYIFVRDENNIPVSGTQFQITVKYPDGRTGSYKSETDGSCYLVNLNSGLYEISMNTIDGFSSCDPVKCTVKDSVSYQPIENVEEIVEIKDLSQGLNEIKANQETEATQETTIDYIISDTVSSSPDESITNFVYDSNGNKTYTYTYKTDDAGYILLRNGQSSDVLPNEENSILICGLRFNSDINGYETVTLFKENNLPIDEYMIEAEPITITQTQLNGWQTENGKVVYYNNGEKLSGLKNIDGKLYYFDKSGYQANSVGIDVSFYNGNINWAAVKNAGIDYVIIRAGFRGWGSAAIYQDTCFEQNLRNAKAAGLKVGIYFYSTAVNKVEAVEEASICLEWMQSRSLDFPIYIDMEFSGEYPNGRQDLISPAIRTEVALAFCETIKNGGYKPGIYATQSFFSDEINYNSISQYSIWMASFTENYEQPNTNYRYDIWQFTDYGKVAGINGSTDFNVIFN